MPSTLPPSPPRRCEFQRRTQASRCCLCHFAKGGRKREKGWRRGPRKQIQMTRRKKKKSNWFSNPNPLSASHPRRCTVKRHRWCLLESHRKGQNPLFRPRPLIPTSLAVPGGRSEGLLVQCKERAGKEWVPTLQGELSSKMG